MLTKREFLKAIGLFFFGTGIYVVYRNLSYLSRPPTKKIILSTEDLKRIERLYLGDEYIIIRENKGFLVFSRRCPHLGCKLSYDPVNQVILCPCHRSKFTLKGKYIEGPAKKDLKELTFTHKEEGLQIEI
ncbi:MAG: Rieske (2Fe-2S) protein [Caldimicrobium sp.]|nr:Rieske (2Fe-2S) protein [Caldimicrobium sp.]MCX7873337.1 Rieske (2Fe-2S) protein [Caldimicrobium sp.]MDW8093425.1 Rieske (2Fe-2S) protein [Caldimicrobium sp.]